MLPLCPVCTDIPRLQTLITEKLWWDSSDVLDRIVGDIALRHPEVNTVLLAWSPDDNIWLRRVAVDHQLLRKQHTDTALLEKIICNNLGQKEFFGVSNKFTAQNPRKPYATRLYRPPPAQNGQTELARSG